MIPVILDSDLGTDLDDHWAILMLLNSPELDIRLIAVGTGDTEYRAQLLIDVLIAAERTDIPVAIGRATPLPEYVPVNKIQRIADTRSPGTYPGVIHRDAARAIVDTINSSEEEVTILAIGPVTNLAAAHELEPSISQRSRVIAMAAGLRMGIGGEPGAHLEYNVIVDIPAFATLLDSDWDIVLSPLDSCGLISLGGNRYARLRASAEPGLMAVMRAYEEWSQQWPEVIDEDHEFAEIFGDRHPRTMYERQSTILFDTLPVYLAYAQAFAELETVKVAMSAEGLVAEAEQGRAVSAAVGWLDLEGYLDHLTDRLLAGRSKR